MEACNFYCEPAGSVVATIVQRTAMLSAFYGFRSSTARMIFNRSNKRCLQHDRLHKSELYCVTPRSTCRNSELSRAAAMPCLRNLGKALRLYDLPGRGHAAWPAILQAAAATQPRATLHDFECEPATGTPAHPFQPVASSSTTGDTFVPKGAKLSGHGAHPLARYRWSIC